MALGGIAILTVGYFLINKNSKPAQKSTTAPTKPKVSIQQLKKKILDISKSNPNNIMAQVFASDQKYFDSLNQIDKRRLLQICNSGIQNPQSQTGCYAMNPSDYDDFKPFFSKVLQKYHKVDLSKTKHQNNWDLSSIKDLPQKTLDVSKLGLPEMSMRVRTGRNLKKYPLPGKMTRQDRINMEGELIKVFQQNLIKNQKFGGNYYSLTPGLNNSINEEKYNELVKSHIMFKDMSNDSFLNAAGISSDWPYGRGCYVSADKGFIIWVGQQDHLRIMAMKKSTILNQVFDRLKSAIDFIENKIPGGCAKSKDFGVITSCPTNIGTGMRASVHIKVPKLTADGTDKKAKQICKQFGLSVRGTGGEHTPIGKDGTIDLSPSARFCISQAQILASLYKGIKKVWQKEQK